MKDDDTPCVEAMRTTQSAALHVKLLLSTHQPYAGSPFLSRPAAELDLIVGGERNLPTEDYG